MDDAHRDADPGPAPGTVLRNPIPPLLESLGRDHLDPGYAQAAARRAEAARAGDAAVRQAGPGRSRPVRSRAPAAAVAAALAVAGVLFGIAASTTEREQPRQEQARSGLLADVQAAQDRQDELAATASALAGELRATQSVLGADAALQTVAQLEQAAGLTDVTGPGLRVQIDQGDPEDSSGEGGSAILDRDIQLLVNDLWSTGAEAMAVGGVRLRPTSSIRQAGDSILVDNRPVSWPIAIDAVGDSASMQVAFVRTAGFGRFSSFAQLYGIRFDVTTETTLTLPAGTAASDLRYAATTGG